MVSNLIHNGDFCEIVTDKFLHENVKRGHLVYVVGHKALPTDETDPYTQRIKFLAHLVKDEHVIAKEIYVIDPVSLAKVPERKQKRLVSIFIKDFQE